MTTTIADLPKHTSATPTITIYGPYDCPNCQTAIDLFTRKNIAYTKVDLESGDANHTYVTQELGYATAPVIVVEFVDHDPVHWGGARNDMLTVLVRVLARIDTADASQAS